MDATPRAHTPDECREMFLDLVADYVRYWRRQVDTGQVLPAAALSGLAFSLLVILDGEAATLPGFALIPNPHPDDEAYHRAHGKQWWPLSRIEDAVDIAGGLHDGLYWRPDGSPRLDHG